MRLLAQRIVRDVWLWAKIHAGAAFVVEVAKAGEAFLAAGTGDEVAFAALREHALAHDAGADRLVAGIGILTDARKNHDPDDARGQRPAPIRHRVLKVRPPCSNQRAECINLCTNNYFKHAQPVRVATKHVRLTSSHPWKLRFSSTTFFT